MFDNPIRCGSGRHALVAFGVESVSYRGLETAFDPQAKEKAFCCPRARKMLSGIVSQRARLDLGVERGLFRGTAVEFSAFLNVWRELPHSRAVLDDPGNAAVPGNTSAPIALRGSFYRLADDICPASACAAQASDPPPIRSRHAQARPRKPCGPLRACSPA